MGGFAASSSSSSGLVFRSHLRRLARPFMPLPSTNPFKRYIQGDKNKFMEDRAPSTADTMREMGEEKDRHSQMLKQKQGAGVASQTTDKFNEAAEEAVLGDSPTPDSVKERYKEADAGEDCRRRGDTSSSTV